MYYVKTDELFYVVEEWFKTTGYNSEPHAEKAKKIRVLALDRHLYLRGSFCSPDLEKYYDSRASL